MLEDRARRSEQSVSVEVDWAAEPNPVTPVLTSQEADERWLESEGAELQPRPLSFSDRLGRDSPGTLAGLAAELSNSAGLAGAMGLRDNRTRDQYLQEVAGYMAKVRRTLARELRARAVRRDLGRLDLVLKNLTEHNFDEVEVVLRIGGARALLRLAERCGVGLSQ